MNDSSDESIEILLLMEGGSCLMIDWRMVGVAVCVQRFVIWFPVRLVFSVDEIHSNVKEVRYLLIALHNDLQTKLVENLY